MAQKHRHIEGQTVASRVNRHTHWAHKVEKNFKTFPKAQQKKRTKQNTHCTKQCQVHNRLDRFSSVGSWSITLHHASLQNGEANKYCCFWQYGISSNSTKMLIEWSNLWRTGLEPIWSPQTDLPLEKQIDRHCIPSHSLNQIHTMAIMTCHTNNSSERVWLGVFAEWTWYPPLGILWVRSSEITPGKRGISDTHHNQSHCDSQQADHCTDTTLPQFWSCDQETEPAWGTHPWGSVPGSGCCHHQLQTGHPGLGSGSYHMGDTPHLPPAPSPPTPPPHSHRTQLWWHLGSRHWSQWAWGLGCSRWSGTSPHLTWWIWWGWILLWSSSAAGWGYPSHCEQQTSHLPPPDTFHQDNGFHHESQQKHHHSQHQSTWSSHSPNNQHPTPLSYLWANQEQTHHPHVDRGSQWFSASLSLKRSSCRSAEQAELTQQFFPTAPLSLMMAAEWTWFCPTSRVLCCGSPGAAAGVASGTVVRWEKDFGSRNKCRQQFTLCVCQECDPVKINMKAQVLSWNYGVEAELKICSTTRGLSHFMTRILMFRTKSWQLHVIELHGESRRSVSIVWPQRFSLLNDRASCQAKWKCYFESDGGSQSW